MKSYLYAATDSIVVICSLVAAFVIRELVNRPIQPFFFYLPFLVSAILFLLASFLLFGLYERERTILSLSYLIDFLKACFLYGAGLIAFSFFTKTDYSRAVVSIFFVLSIIALYLARFFIAFLESRGSGGIPADPVREIASALERRFAESGDPLQLLEEARFTRSPTFLFYVLKRAIDIAGALVGLAVTTPFFPFIARFIRRESKGPIFISQKRVGLRGKTFIMYKFRTMAHDTPLYAEAPRQSDDPRITRAGKMLRAKSIDELPQFWNVLKGDMSLVGPRPEMPFLAARYEPWQRVRLEVKPGITGLWQIFGRKDLPLSEHLEYDLYYVCHQSLFLDLAILLRTIPHLFFPKGAY